MSWVLTDFLRKFRDVSRQQGNFLLPGTKFSASHRGLCLARPVIPALKDLSPDALDWSKVNVFLTGEWPGCPPLSFCSLLLLMSPLSFTNYVGFRLEALGCF